MSTVKTYNGYTVWLFRLCLYIGFHNRLPEERIEKKKKKYVAKKKHNTQQSNLESSKINACALSYEFIACTTQIEWQNAQSHKAGGY